MIKVKFHSMVDVITNSSTVIYTYQDSVKEAKELLQEILKLSGDDRDVNDVFWFGVFFDDTDNYTDYLDGRIEDYQDCLEGYNSNSNYKEQDAWMAALQEKIMKGEVSKPKWMSDVLDSFSDEYCPDTSLCIICKDEKYNGTVEKMLKFLNSPSSDGGRDD